MKALRIGAMVIVIVLATFLSLSALMNLVRSIGTVADDSATGLGAIFGSLLMLALGVVAIVWAARSIRRIGSGVEGPEGPDLK